MAPERPRPNTQSSRLAQHGPSDEKAKKVYKRTRTGCTTCRNRKMKCDEVKPTCGNCSKSRRDCVWHDLTFRHNQNAGLNEDNNSLGKFYRGSGTFTQEQRNNFVRVSNDLQFTPMLSPIAGINLQPRQAPAALQYPDHTLQTLAATAAAVQYPPHIPPYGSYPTYTQVAQAPQTAPVTQAAHNPNINALLNPTNTPASMIDPTLETAGNQVIASATAKAGDGEMLAGIKDHAEAKDGDMTETDTKLAHALQGFSDGQGKEPNNAEGQG